MLTVIDKQDVCFLLTDTKIIYEDFLEDINNIIK